MQQPTWIGHRLSGRYLIESELGAGGMSAVYKAQDPNLRRVVAIKLIHAHLSKDPEFVRRFEAEAAVVAQMRHPNIVQVYDFNHDGDTYYIVFEFVPGETLQGRLKRYQDAGRQMPMKEVMSTALGIGRALQYAHEREIAHRDIKPANVMINVHGEAILTDFGIVKIVGGTSHTATGAVMGTARYMSPEQIRGQKVDTRTDIYSYGVMLYEMLGGRAPFSAESAMTLMMMHVNDPVPDIRNLRPGLPAGLVSVVGRALAKNPAERYQTMRELLADLERAQSGQPVAAPPRPSAPDANLTMLDEDAGNPAGSTEVISEYVAPPTGPQQPAASRTAPLQAAPLGQTAAGSSGGSGGNRALLFGIGGVILLALLLGGVYFVFFRGDGAAISQNGDNVAAVSDDDEEEATDVPEIPEDEESEPTEEPEEPEEEPTEEPTPVPTEVPPTATTEPTAVPTDVPPTPTTEPTATAYPTAAPTPVPTAVPTVATTYSAAITSISLEGSTYVVNYTTNGYTEALPGQHVHFFFNTVPPEQAGLPGGGPWTVYGGPRPFTQLGPGNRPANATQLCVLSANPDHSVIAGSGNCWNLP